ncbi:hypothetical protein AHiyo6_04960 [Arthrobacter sp. Hiyo6]|nr:hypothetical protein AHiyo6_04960 [Arthrobacter sp. Hiyo6]
MRLRSSHTRSNTIEGNTTMTREEAFARCPSDSYVEFYGNQWLIVPFARVVQPAFFDCTPGLRLTRA